MKNLLLTIGILIANFSFAAENPTLINEIQPDIVVANFSIKDVRIKFIYTQGAEKEISLSINHKFSEFLIQKAHSSSGVSNINLTFKKS